MGNRAVITASTEPNGLGIYLHWNGGIESVLAFVDVAKARGFRDPASDESYGMARLCGLLHEFFGVNESTSLGLGTLDRLDCDNFDNGVFVIGKGWTIVSRWGSGSRPLAESNLDAIRETEHYQAIVKELSNNT